MESTKPPSSSPCNSETNNNHQIRDAPQRLIFILIDFRHFLSHILKDLQLALTGRRIVKSATQILIVIRQIQIHRPSKRPKSLLLGAANPILIRKKPQFVKHINHTDEINLLSPNRRKINRRTSPLLLPVFRNRYRRARRRY